MTKVNFEIKVNRDVFGTNDMEFGFVECDNIYSRFFLPNDNNEKLSLVLYANANGEDIAIGKIETVIRDGKSDLELKILDSELSDDKKYIDDMISIQNTLKDEFVK